MSHKIWGVAQPEMVFEIIEHALKHGRVEYSDVEDILRKVRNKTKAGGYLNFCVQSGLLCGQSANRLSSIGPFVPTQRGRQQYAEALEDPKATLHFLLGSIPWYRFHVELVLAELVMASALRGSTQASSIKGYVWRNLPSFLGGRLPWIQQAIGWTDSLSYSLSNWTHLQQKLARLNRIDDFVESSAYVPWDQRLGFANGTDLSRTEKLCSFLRSVRQEPLWTPNEILSTTSLVVLVLMMIAREQRYALQSSYHRDSLDELLRIGIEIRLDDSAAYLSNAVKLVIRDTDTLRGNSPAPLGLPVLDDLFKYLQERVGADPCATIGLDELVEHIRADMLDNGFFVSTAFADNDTAAIPSTIEIWSSPCFTHAEDHDFLAEIVDLTSRGAKGGATRRQVFLNTDLLMTATPDVASLMAHNPHFAMLVLMVCDLGGAAERLRLTDEGWHYGSVELTSAIDQILRHLGYQVWDEWYRLSPEHRRSLGRELVNLACRAGVCYVDGSRLIEQQNGSISGEYYYRAWQVVNIIRNLELEHE